MPERVLVTGINSFTGPYLAAELAGSGYDVYGLSQRKFSSDHATSLVGDILDKDSLETAVRMCCPTRVIHLAAITYVPHGDIAEMYLTNVVGTRNLLEVLAGQDNIPGKILLASSANVYGNAVEGSLSETTPFAPANDYAASKVAMEYMAGMWFDKLPISIVRPFNYTGVGQTEKFLIPKIVTHFQRRESQIELGNLDVIRDFSDVRFVSAAYRGLLEAAEPGGAYNICSGSGYSLKNVIASMNEIAGYKISVVVNPDFVRSNEVKTLVGINQKLCDLCPSLEVIPLQETLGWMYSQTA